METKALSEQVAGYSLDLTSDQSVKTLTQTVARGATAPELAMFIEMCKSTGLNPFKREIWFIKDKMGNCQMMTGINGFYSIANNHPQYDGTEIELVEEGGKLVKAIARVHRKDRKLPSVAEAYWSEYAKPYGNWKSMPRVMLSKCAESMALRKAFPQQLNGLYTTEEMPNEFAAPPAPTTNGNGHKAEIDVKPADDLPQPIEPDMGENGAIIHIYGFKGKAHKDNALAKLKPHERDSITLRKDFADVQWAWTSPLLIEDLAKNWLKTVEVDEDGIIVEHEKPSAKPDNEVSFDDDNIPF